MFFLFSDWWLQPLPSYMMATMCSPAFVGDTHVCQTVLLHSLCSSGFSSLPGQRDGTASTALILRLNGYRYLVIWAERFGQCRPPSRLARSIISRGFLRCCVHLMLACHFNWKIHLVAPSALTVWTVCVFKHQSVLAKSFQLHGCINTGWMFEVLELQEVLIWLLCLRLAFCSFVQGVPKYLTH